MCAVRGGFCRVQQPMPTQDLGHRRRGGDACYTQITQAARQLAPAPTRMGLPEGDNLSLNLRRTAPRTAVRTARTVQQTIRSGLTMTPKIAKTGLPADAKTTAQLRDTLALHG